MKAIVYTKYGPPEVLKLKEVAKPTPKDDEVLIRVHAATVNKGDCEMRSPKIPNVLWLLVRIYFGLTKPRKQILGAYLAGGMQRRHHIMRVGKPTARRVDVSIVDRPNAQDATDPLA